MAHPERIIPDETEPGIVALHAARYEFALRFCMGVDVLDAACGVGYGTAILAGAARRVLGVDRDRETIAYARARYGATNIEFRVMDVTELDVEDASVDVVCSFETLEHLDEPSQLVDEAARVLRAGGVLVASTPHVAATTRRPANPHHRIELSRADLEALLRTRFVCVELHGQVRRRTRRHRAAQRLDVLGLRRRVPLMRRAARSLTGSPATEALGMDDVSIVRGQFTGASEVVAVCRKPQPA